MTHVTGRDEGTEAAEFWTSAEWNFWCKFEHLCKRSNTIEFCVVKVKLGTKKFRTFAVYSLHVDTTGNVYV